MGNGTGLSYNPCAEITLDGVSIDVETIENAAVASVANFNIGPIWTIPISWSYKFKVKKLWSGNGAPAAHLMEAAEAFGLITEKQCAEGLQYYSNRIHARHMKRQRKHGTGTGYKWERKRSNHIGKP